MPRAKIVCYLSDYPHITSELYFDYDEEDAEGYDNLDDALGDWAAEEIGKSMVFEWRVEPA